MTVKNSNRARMLNCFKNRSPAVSPIAALLAIHPAGSRDARSSCSARCAASIAPDAASLNQDPRAKHKLVTVRGGRAGVVRKD